MPERAGRKKKPSPERQPRAFEKVGEGGLWQVMRYSDRGVDTMNERNVAKVLKLDEVVRRNYAEIIGEEVTPENLRDRLVRERAYLHRAYDKELPHLLPREKVILSPTNDGGSRIVAVQELMDDALWPETLEMHDLPNEDQVREEMHRFIEITKELALKGIEDGEFHRAIPDLKARGNLLVSRTNADDQHHLRLVDTNYVLPIDHPVSQEFALFRMSAVSLLELESDVLRDGAPTPRSEPLLQLIHAEEQYLRDIESRLEELKSALMRSVGRSAMYDKRFQMDSYKGRFTVNPHNRPEHVFVQQGYRQAADEFIVGLARHTATPEVIEERQVKGVEELMSEFERLIATLAKPEH